MDDNLLEVFSKYGKIVSAKVMLDPNTGRSVCEHGRMMSESMEVSIVNLLLGLEGLGL